MRSVGDIGASADRSALGLQYFAECPPIDRALHSAVQAEGSHESRQESGPSFLYLFTPHSPRGESVAHPPILGPPLH
jgi:hypothetical protein